MIDMSKLYSHSDYSDALLSFQSNKKWSTFKPVQLNTSNNRCPICECRLDNTFTREIDDKSIIIEATIDHYRPKAPGLYPFLKFEHKNYLLMCSECNNAYKGNQFPLHCSTPVRATTKNTLHTEKPLIVNPITENPLDIFKLVLKYTGSGRKVLELQPKCDSGYLYEKAMETIKVFSLGNTDINVHSSESVHNCRIDLLNDHYKKFSGLISAMQEKDKTKAAHEIKKYNLNHYGFFKFITSSQYENLI